MYWAALSHKRRPPVWPWYTALLAVTRLASALILIQSSWQQTRQNVPTTRATPTPISVTWSSHSPLVGDPPVTTILQPSAHPVAILPSRPPAAPQPQSPVAPQSHPVATLQPQEPAASHHTNGPKSKSKSGSLLGLPGPDGENCFPFCDLNGLQHLQKEASQFETGLLSQFPIKLHIRWRK